ncbi:DUF3999 family protein [Paenibacillus massiliensis]|uniref:DUF3999 family protein n=1 Tax=Paenibacillus massiliensis TaxID=225917 RepID=UPI0012EBAD43|nr:DUF3999 family protein [Paenibacillus massiliensis]
MSKRRLPIPMSSLLRSMGCLLGTICLLLVLSPSSVTHGTAADPTSAWKFKKMIEITNSSTYYSVLLDEEVYAEASAGLEDIRIVDSTGQFIPFYMENTDMYVSAGQLDEGQQEKVSKQYHTSLLRTTKADGHTSFDYKVMVERELTDPVINHLIWTLPSAMFLKQVEVYGSYDGAEWTFLDKAQLYRTDKNQKNSIEWEEAQRFQYYRLRVLDNAEELAFPELLLEQKVRIDDNRQPISRQAVPAFDISEEGTLTMITVHNPQHLLISRLELEVEGSFKRTYRLLDETGRLVATREGSELYQLSTNDSRSKPLTITPELPLKDSRLQIEISNGDDSPLSMLAIRNEYILDRLVFEARGTAPYALLYGNQDAEAPDYDLAAFKPYIDQAHPSDILLGTQQANTTYREPTGELRWWFQTEKWFRVIMMIVTILLVIYLVRKLSYTNNKS